MAEKNTTYRIFEHISDVDISEQDIMDYDPAVLDKLLIDHTMSAKARAEASDQEKVVNIFWATSDYENSILDEHGNFIEEGYRYDDEIKPEHITGRFRRIVMPRVLKDKQAQLDRTKDKAEVFTPSWVCNAQNNLIDENWFGRKDVFNREVTNEDGTHSWIPSEGKIQFPEGNKQKTWKKYVVDNCMEITCGEAPYLVSRYDTTTGQPIPISHRIGIDGYYKRVTKKSVERVDNIVGSYAYDKKAQNLYVITPYSNLVITLTKDYAKIIKKNKSIPQVAEDELDMLVQKYSKQLDDKYTALNDARTRHIQDSIAKAKADSIEIEKLKAERLAKLKKERSDYMETHNWRMVPTGNKSLYCDECEKSFSEDSLFTIGIKNDTIYYFTRTDGRLGYTYITGHKSELSQSLKEYSPFRYHYEIFKDSLTDESEDYDMITSELSYHYLDEYVKRLKKRAPYGFFTDWGWDSEYSCISFNFNYMNTNRNTIKYIDVYFKVTNDVGDLRKTGHFQGTGPLREFESASWEWDTSYYYVSGDASNMNITKVILTYMNGTKKVLTGKLLVFE